MWECWHQLSAPSCPSSSRRLVSSYELIASTQFTEAEGAAPLIQMGSEPNLKWFDRAAPIFKADMLVELTSYKQSITFYLTITIPLPPHLTLGALLRALDLLLETFRVRVSSFWITPTQSQSQLIWESRLEVSQEPLWDLCGFRAPSDSDNLLNCFLQHWGTFHIWPWSWKHVRLRPGTT